MASHTPTIKLNTGASMPQVGLGTWKIPNEKCTDTVYSAIKLGYRLIDGAFDYANEREVGAGVQRALKDNLVSRSDLFLVSKLWNTFHAPADVEAICRQQLEWWGLDYFDLFLIHFPVAQEYVDYKQHYPTGWYLPGTETVKLANIPIQQTWAAMESLVEKGLVKAIGVSNFQGALLLDLLRYAKIRPATLQVELHPYLVQQELVELCKEENIAVTAYSSFGPLSFVELDFQKAVGCSPLLFENAVVQRIATKHAVGVAAVLLAWSVKRGCAVIPKAGSEGRLKENLECVKVDLEEEEVGEISGLDRGLRFNNPGDYLGTLRIFA